MRALRLIAGCLMGAALMLLTAACTPTSETKIDDTLASEQVQTGIQLACVTYQGIKAGYDIYIEGKEIRQSVKDKIELATTAVGSLCTPPYPNSTSSLIAKVTQAGVTVFLALQEQKKADAVEAMTPPG